MKTTKNPAGARAPLANIGHCRLTVAELEEIRALCAAESARSGLNVSVSAFIRRAVLAGIETAKKAGAS